jgi:hypothetical protein
MLPSDVHTSLVKKVRKQLEGENEDYSIVSTGDVLTAWLFKVFIFIYFAQTTKNLKMKQFFCH